MSKQLKTKEQLLADYKKANKERRKKIVTKAGYVDEGVYLLYLKTPEQVKLITSLPSPVAKAKSSRRKKPQKAEDFLKPVVHNVSILDATGSMRYDKYNNSIIGIKTEIEALKVDPNVEWKYTLIEFIQKDGYGLSDIINKRVHFQDIPISNVSSDIKFNGADGGNTPLYQIVYDTITDLRSRVKSTDKVLIKVYTDGGDNETPEYLSRCANLIKDVQKENFTVTFVATNQDMRGIVNALKLDDSNTLAVSNDGAGFERGFKMSLASTRTYSAKVAKGQDVSSNFYGKQSGKL